MPAGPSGAQCQRLAPVSQASCTGVGGVLSSGGWKPEVRGLRGWLLPRLHGGPVGEPPPASLLGATGRVRPTVAFSLDPASPAVSSDSPHAGDLVSLLTPTTKACFPTKPGWAALGKDVGTPIGPGWGQGLHLVDRPRSLTPLPQGPHVPTGLAPGPRHGARTHALRPQSLERHHAPQLPRGGRQRGGHPDRLLHG